MSTAHARPVNTPLVLVIRDGWGHNPYGEHDAFNAVKLARTPTAEMLDREWPRTLIRTSGADVGLPAGTMGNSEVGHQNIGAGRVVEQESKTITDACARGFETIPVVSAAISRAFAAGKSVHLMGICSDAGVHGLLEHLYTFLQACERLGNGGGALQRVYIHLFTDGRDTGPRTGLEYARQVDAACRRIGVGRIASVIGRYYAMDRDNRWERVARAYACLTGLHAGELEVSFAPSAEAAIERYYRDPTNESQQGDEFITPAMIGPTPQDARGYRISDGDTVISYNFRGDRPRELSAAFVFPDDKWAQVKPSPDSGRRGFERGRKLDVEYLTLTEYWEELKPYVKPVFTRPPRMVNILGEYVSKRGLRQFRCAETEKYPHVTFFFNDYRDPPFDGETRENPQSPRVATYDLKPEMAAEEVCQAVLRRLAAPGAECEDLIVVNFANGDMVGHTGNLAAAIQACEVVDGCVGRIVDATLARGGSLIVTADHGNAEQMWNPETNSPHTAHTTYEVPLYVVGGAGGSFKGRGLRSDGRLGDIAPTALAMMGLPIPAEMTGASLLI